jgi:cobalt-zinc-cadmium efflux system outer membrane protein
MRRSDDECRRKPPLFTTEAVYAAAMLIGCTLIGCTTPAKHLIAQSTEHQRPVGVTSPQRPTFLNIAQSVQQVAFQGGDQNTADEQSDKVQNKEDQSDDTQAIDAESADESGGDEPVPPSDSISQPADLASLIETALTTHPQIRAARQRVAAATNRIPRATALDDPTFSNTFWPIHEQALQTAGGRVDHQFGFSQKVPWPTKLHARGTVARREVLVAQAEVVKAEREIVEAVRLAYYELWLADELIRIVDDNKELVSDLITVAEARYKTGGSQQDVLRAELEGDKLENQLIALQRQKEQARSDLGTLVRMPLDLMPTAFAELDVGEVVPQLQSLVASAEQCNPALQGLAAEIARDQAKETVACLNQYPDFRIGLGYAIINDNSGAISPVANGHDNLNLSVGVTLPIWRDKINAGIREAAHERSSTMHRREAVRDQLRGTLRRQVASAYASVQQLDLFRDRLVPRTEQTLQIATAEYQGRKANFTDLVDIYQELLAYQVQVARTRAALASTLAHIERTVGCEVNANAY